MSTSVFVNGMPLLSVPAGWPGVPAAAPQLAPPVLHGRRRHEDGDDGTGRETHRDRVTDLLVPLQAERVRDAGSERLLEERLEVGRARPADLLLGVVHP